MTEPMDLIQSRANRLVEDHFNLMRALVDMRHEHGLTQQEVGERMGVSQASVAKFERVGSNPTLASLRRYAIAVGAIFDTQVVDDCAEERRNSSDFYAVVRESGLANADWLNFKRVEPVRISANWTQVIEPLEAHIHG